MRRAIAHGLPGGILLALTGIAATAARSWCLASCLRTAEQADIAYGSCMEKCQDLEAKLEESIENDEKAKGEEAKQQGTRAEEFLQCEELCNTAHPKVGLGSGKGELPEDYHTDEIACSDSCHPPGWLAFGSFFSGMLMVIALILGIVSGCLGAGCVVNFAPEDGRGSPGSSRGLGGLHVEKSSLHIYVWLFLALAAFLFVAGLFEETEELGLKLTCLLVTLVCLLIIAFAELTQAVLGRGGLGEDGSDRARDIPFPFGKVDDDS